MAHTLVHIGEAHFRNGSDRPHENTSKLPPGVPGPPRWATDVNLRVRGDAGAKWNRHPAQFSYGTHASVSRHTPRPSVLAYKAQLGQRTCQRIRAHPLTHHLEAPGARRIHARAALLLGMVT